MGEWQDSLETVAAAEAFSLYNWLSVLKKMAVLTEQHLHSHNDKEPVV